MSTLGDAIRARWGQNGDWNQGGIDRAEELAALLQRSGVNSLDNWQVTKGRYDPTTGQWLQPTDARYSAQPDWQADPWGAQAPTDAFRFTVGGQDIGHLGNVGNLDSKGNVIGPDGTFGWSAGGHGNVSYQLGISPDGQPSMQPLWGSSSDAGDVRTAAMVLGAPAAIAYGAGALGLNGASPGAGLLGGGGPEVALAGGGAAEGGGTLGALGGAAPAVGAPIVGGGVAPLTVGELGVAGIPEVGGGLAGGGLTAGQVLSGVGAASSAGGAGARVDSSGNVLDAAGRVLGKIADMSGADLAKLGLLGLTGAAAAASLNGANVGSPDSRLLDAQIGSLDTQSSAIKQILANNQQLLPLQQQLLRQGITALGQGQADAANDRQYAVGRRALLTGLQNRMVEDANAFNTTDMQHQLAGQAISDVTRSFDAQRGQAVRDLTRTGVNPNDGRYMGTIANFARDEALAKAAAGTQAARAARAEGYALTDRAAGSLAGAPALATGATNAGVTYGTGGVPLVNASQTGMNAGPTSAAQIASQVGANATQMYGTQGNYLNHVPSTDLSGLGSVIGAAARAYSIWGT